MMKTININNLVSELDFDIDYFFCCASFEKRCLSVANNVAINRIANSAICFNEDQVATFKGFEVELRQRLSSTNYSEIGLNSSQPMITASRLKKYLDNIIYHDQKIFLIDITTFTHEALLILFRLLIAKKIPGENIFYVYNNALDYATNEKELSKKWLSAGVKEIRSIIGFSGFMSPLKKNLLIVLVGFEPDRTIKIINEYQPDAISLGVGYNYCSDIGNSVEFNKSIHKQILSEFQNAKTFEFSVLDPIETGIAVKKEILEHPNMNIILAPMNNKISTLGVGKLAIETPNIQLCYIPARYYNISSYSLPGEKIFIFRLH